MSDEAKEKFPVIGFTDDGSGLSEAIHKYAQEMGMKPVEVLRLTADLGTRTDEFKTLLAAKRKERAA